MGDVPEPIRATVLADGIPVKGGLDGRSIVWQPICELLPEYEKARAGDYVLSPEDDPPLDPFSRLGDCDVPNEPIFALTRWTEVAALATNSVNR